MAKEFDNTNTGTLFKNDMEGKSENFPPYGGKINVNGAEYWVSAWLKEGKGGKFFSLAIKPKDEQAKPKNGSPPPARNDEPFPDDDIPF